MTVNWLDQTTRVEGLQAEIALIRRDADLNDDAKQRRVSEMNKAALQDIAADFRHELSQAASEAKTARQALAEARTAALSPMDPARFAALQSTIRGVLALSPDEPGNGPMEKARQLAAMAENDRDMALALVAAAGEVGASWDGRDAAMLKKQLAERALVSPAVEAAEAKLIAAENRIENVRAAVRRYSGELTPSDLRQSMASGQPTELERLVAGESGDIWQAAGIEHHETGVPTGQGGSENLQDVFGIVAASD